MCNKVASLALAITCIFFSSCKTKSELRREQELDKLRQEVSQVRGNKADVEVLSEELKVELTRLGNVTEEQAAQSHRQYEEMQQRVEALTTRVQALEQRAVQEDRPSPAEKPAPNAYEAGKKLFEDGKYDDATEILRGAVKSRKGDEARKAQFLLGESLFAGKDFASAALEFSEYRKKFPKDSLVPNAIYRQANAFRSMNKSKEARLFYTELLEKFPKHSLAGKAKAEVKKLK